MAQSHSVHCHNMVSAMGSQGALRTPYSIANRTICPVSIIQSTSIDQGRCSQAESLSQRSFPLVSSLFVPGRRYLS